MNRPTRSELLAAYARKPIQRFAQMDAHINQEWDDVIRPDDEGDGLTAGVAYDLANCDAVRVRFPDGTAREDVARALRKILDWVERSDLWEPRGEGEEPFFGKAEPVDWAAHWLDVIDHDEEARAQSDELRQEIGI